MESGPWMHPSSVWRGWPAFSPPLVENSEEESGLKTGQMTKCWRIWGSQPNSRRASGQPLGGAPWHWCSSQPRSSHAGQTCEDPAVPCPGGPRCVPELCASLERTGLSEGSWLILALLLGPRRARPPVQGQWLGPGRAAVLGMVRRPVAPWTWPLRISDLVTGAPFSFRSLLLDRLSWACPAVVLLQHWGSQVHTWRGAPGWVICSSQLFRWLR